MAWLTFLFALELGLIPRAHHSLAGQNLVVVEPWQVGYTMLEVEAEAFDLLYTGGWVRTYVAVGFEGQDFWPFTSDYGFETGLRHSFWSVFWRHECWHPTTPSGRPLSLEDGSVDTIGLRLEVRSGED